MIKAQWAISVRWSSKQQNANFKTVNRNIIATERKIIALPSSAMVRPNLKHLVLRLEE